MRLRIGDEPLAPAALVAAARGGALDVELTPAARERMASGHRAAEDIAAVRPVYGRTTGVGANRHVDILDDLGGHALRLLRSHAGGLGEPLPDGRRARDRSSCGSRRWRRAAAAGPRSPWRSRACWPRIACRRSATSAGSGPATSPCSRSSASRSPARARTASPPRLAIAPGDALPLMSSNAATFATAALVWADLCELLDAGSASPRSASRRCAATARRSRARSRRPARCPASRIVSARLRALTAGAEPPARRQDPFGLRCLPPVAGALRDALAGLHDVLAVEINAAAENPLFAGGEALHNGGFHAASCALALDSLRLALVPFGSLAGARLSHLMAPDLTGLAPFLAADASGSSGLMIAEYLAGDALARLRTAATPAVLGSVSISRGLEEHASFAWQSAGHARRVVGLLRTVLGLEWVAAERALRMREVPAAGVLAPARALAGGFDDAARGPAARRGRARAEAALPALAELVRAVA